MEIKDPVTILESISKKCDVFFDITTIEKPRGTFKAVLVIGTNSYIAIAKTEENACRLSALKATLYPPPCLDLEVFYRVQILANESKVSLKVFRTKSRGFHNVIIDLCGQKFIGIHSNYLKAIEEAAFSIIQNAEWLFGNLFQEENALLRLLLQNNLLQLGVDTQDDKQTVKRTLWQTKEDIAAFDQIKQKNEEIEQLKSKVNYLKLKITTQNTNKSKLLKQKDEKIKQLRSNVQSLKSKKDEDLKQKEEENKELKLYVETLLSKRQSLVESLRSKTQSLKQKDKDIKQLKSYVNSLKSKINTQDWKLKLMKKKDEELKKLRSEVESLKSKVQDNKLEKHVLNKNEMGTGSEQTTDFLSRFVEEFEDIAFIGYGGFAVVFQCRNKIDKKQYAIKRIPIPRCGETKMKCLRESQALAKLNHPSIVGYTTSWWEAPPKHWQSCCDKLWYPETCSTPSWAEPPEWQDLKDGSDEINDVSFFGSCSCLPKKDCLNKPPVYLYIQMELCAQTLRDWLNKREKVISKSSYKIFIQILEAVVYFHNKGMLHRDLKPGNIFLSKDGPNKDIKIGDFGLATEVSMESEDLCTSFMKHYHTKDVGTELYKAPEQKSGRHYDKKVDIYALGIIFFELFHHMGTESEKIEVVHRLKENKEFPDSVHESKRKVILKLMSNDPSQRPSADTIMKMKEFAEFTDELFNTE